jgi:hypothetical protein
VKIYPYISSSILLDTLELAIYAREIDMRASPYDLYQYDIEKYSDNKKIQCNTSNNKITRRDFNRTPIRI